MNLVRGLIGTAIRKDQNESSTEKAARRTATATIWLAVLTLVLAIVSSATLLVLRSQLKEMHDGGVDTHNLAEASANQALWTQKLADASKDQAGRTRDLAVQMKEQANHTEELTKQATIQAKAAQIQALQATLQAQEAKVAAEAASQTAQTGERGLELSERPWLVITASLISGLTYTSLGGEISVRYTVANLGKTTAVGYPPTGTLCETT